MRPAAVAVVVLILTGLTGCGTMENFARSKDGGERPLEVYGGVTRSTEAFKDCFTNPDLVVVAVKAPFSPLFAGDILLSAVADTLTLPLTFSAMVTRSIHAYYFPDGRPPESDLDDVWRPFWYGDAMPTPAVRDGSPRD